MAAGMPTLGEVLAARGQTKEELQTELGTFGIELADETMKRFSVNRPIPKKWGSVLGYAAAAPEDGSPGPDASTIPPGRAGERSPTEPTGAKQAPLPIPVGAIAAERIANTYGLFGGLASMAAGEPRIAQVVDAYSTDIGQAWVRAAEENEFARRVVMLMSAGGATGELVMVHLVLVGGLLYVTGRGPGFGGLYAHRFGPPPPQKPPAGAAADGGAGAGDAPPEPAVGDAPGAVAA